MMIKDIVKEISKDKNVVAIYQFGSHGTKKEKKFSDIDICVFTKKINKNIILNIASYGNDKIDVSLFDTLPIFIKPNVFKGKPLYVKNKFFVAEKFAKSFRHYQDFKKFEQKYWKTLKKRISS